MAKKASTTSKNVWLDPDDAPAWTADVFKRAEARIGEKVIRPATGTLKRGRPKSDDPKVQVTLRLDGDLVRRLRGTGTGWQSRINDALRKAEGI